MADFDQFTSSEPPPMEDDPAADFLAREQDQLAALDDGFDDGFSGEPQPQEAEEQGGDLFAAEPTSVPDQFGGEPAVATDSAELDYDMLGVSGSPPVDEDPQGLSHSSDPLGNEADVAATEPAGGDDFGFDPLATSNEAPVDPYGAFKQPDTQRIVPEKILRWREDQEERLTTKDANSEIKQGEWREIAAKEMEDWYKHRDEQLEKTRTGNSEAEAAFVHDRDEKLPGHEWEKVCRLCDFNPKSSRTTKDVARMRSILLQLKQTPLAR